DLFGAGAGELGDDLDDGGGGVGGGLDVDVEEGVQAEAGQAQDQDQDDQRGVQTPRDQLANHGCSVDGNKSKKEPPAQPQRCREKRERKKEWLRMAHPVPSFLPFLLFSLPSAAPREGLFPALSPAPL